MLNELMKKIFSRNGRPSILLGKKILVIEDGELERRFITRTLEKKGCVVMGTADGEKGVQMAQNESPDLILLDYMMPGIDGREVCLRIKSDGTTKAIPIIFLTGSVSPKNVIDCYEAGAEYYLAKPIDAKTLTHQVELTLQYKEEDLSE